VERQTLQAYIVVNGDIKAEQQVAVLPDAAGKLAAVHTALGASVERGEVIALVDPSRPGVSYELSPVYAPVRGVVVSSPPAVGSTVTTSTVIVNLSGNSAVQVEARIPEREVGQLAPGLRAQLSLEAFPGETFSAVVQRVSPVVDPDSRTKQIILKFDGPANRISRINPGMFARIRLNTRTYNRVLVIPAEAVIEFRGTNCVYVVQEGDQVSLREITTGVTVDDQVQILSGLEEGEDVVIQGQQFLIEGSRVRVVNREGPAAETPSPGPAAGPGNGGAAGPEGDPATPPGGSR
jgi:multidrug efflux pump subunit AcrA (membrane-fusion protein)